MINNIRVVRFQLDVLYVHYISRMQIVVCKLVAEAMQPILMTMTTGNRLTHAPLDDQPRARPRGLRKLLKTNPVRGDQAGGWMMTMISLQEATALPRGVLLTVALVNPKRERQRSSLFLQGGAGDERFFLLKTVK